jgi:triacylglycerol lipase
VRMPAVRRTWWRTLDYAAACRWQAEAVFSRVRPADLVHPSGRTVVLVPGVYEPWRFLLPWARLLHSHGVSVHVLPTLGINRRPIPASAELLAQHLAEHDLRDVTLLAHSKGGLIGKLAMSQADPDGRITDMVAVNTPFAGSRYARWFPVRAVRAFVPTNATIVALAAELEVNTHITSAHSFWDPHVPEGSALDGAADLVLETPGHFRPLMDQRLTALLVDRLT